VGDLLVFKCANASEKRSIPRVKFLKFPSVEPLWNAAFRHDLLDAPKKIFPVRQRLPRVSPASLAALWWNGIQRLEIFIKRSIQKWNPRS
jgi:hypothetical protein